MLFFKPSNIAIITRIFVFLRFVDKTGKPIRTLKHTAVRIIAGAVLLLTAITLVLQTSAVQTALSDALLGKLREKMDGHASIGSIHILPFNTLIIRDFLLTDAHPYVSDRFESQDTVAYCRNLVANFSWKGLKNADRIHLYRVKLMDCLVACVKEDEFSNINRVLDSYPARSFEDEPPPPPLSISIRKFDADNIRLKLLNDTVEPYADGKNCINWLDFDGKGDVRARDISIAGGEVKGRLEHFELTEKSGYRMEHAEGYASVIPGHVRVDAFHMRDKRTELHLPDFEMLYDTPDAFIRFPEEVRMLGVITDSRVSFETINSYSGVFPHASGMTTVEYARFYGPVNNLEISDFNIREDCGCRAGVKGNLQIDPDSGEISIDGELKEFRFTARTLDRLLHAIEPSSQITFDKLSPKERYKLSGRVRGPLNSLYTRMRLYSSAGSLGIKGRIRNAFSENRAPIDISADLSTSDLDIGRIISGIPIHQCTMGARFDAKVTNGKLSLELDSLGVSRLNLLDYNYSGIAAAGTYSGSAFDGRIICSDPNLNFIFQGIFNLSNKTSNALYKFYFNLGYADLYAINVDRRGKSRASFELTADYLDIDGSALIGDIGLHDLRLENGEGIHNIGDISVSSRRNASGHMVDLKSAFAEASYKGEQPIGKALDAIAASAVGKSLPALFCTRKSIPEDAQYELDVKFSDSRDILSFVKPGAYIADGTTVRLQSDGAGNFRGNLKSQRIALGRNYLKHLDISASGISDSLSLGISGMEFNLADILFLDNRLTLDASRDSFGLAYKFDNGTGSGTGGGLIFDGRLSGDEGLSVIFNSKESALTLNGHPWQFHASDVRIDTSGASIGLARLSGTGQSLSVNGGYARHRTDTLNLDLDNFRLGDALRFIGSTLDLESSVSGNAVITSPFKTQAGMTLNLQCDSSEISGYDAGSIRVTSRRVEDADHFKLALTQELDGKRCLVAIGKLFPETGTLDAKLSFDGTRLGYISCLLKDTFDEIDGLISGDVFVWGPLERLSLSSDSTRLDKGKLGLAFTGATYDISGPFHVDDYGLHFDDMAARDGEGGAGIISGAIRYDHLSDFNLDTRVTFDDMNAFDLSYGDGSPIFGRVSADGYASITGPFDALKLNISATTSGDGQVAVPLGNTLASGRTDLLSFKQESVEVDPYEEMMRAARGDGRRIEGLDARISVSVTPEVQLRLDIDNSSGNSLYGRGSGRAELHIPSSGDIDIRGDYTLNEGSFHFGLAGVTSRTFKILGGSRISLVGNPVDTYLDINAIYETKASLEMIMGGSSNAPTSRRTVNCGLHIYDKLSNPHLGFSIEVPDLNPSAQSYFQSAISTEDKLQKQFLALLVSNSFLPGDESGIVNNTNVLLSNAAEIMSGQLNNILKMLKIPLDLGFNYQQARGGTDIFDVALSTQLFNNRVSVNGTVGNRLNGDSRQDIVGDLNIEMKLTRQGDVRASLFSHSADKFTNYLDNSQRNGLGISYQQEFNTFGEFFRNIFSTKKERDERRRLELTETKEKTTISIRNNE